MAQPGFGAPWEGLGRAGPGEALGGGGVGEGNMVLGYFAYVSTLLGYGLAAAASIGANCIQGLGGLVVSVLVYHALYAVPSVKKLAY